MNIQLICSNHYELLLKEFLHSKNLIVSESASISFVEKGYPVPKKGISVVFDPNYLNDMVLFLDALSNKQDSMKDKIIGRIEESYEIISYEDIILFESEGNYVYSITHNKKYKVKEKLYQLEELLVGHGFIRINKSCLVNILHINEIIPWFAGKLLLKLNNKSEIEVSRNYVRDFKKFLRL